MDNGNGQLATDNGLFYGFGFRQVVILAIQNSRDRAAHFAQLRPACVVQQHNQVSVSRGLYRREGEKGRRGEGEKGAPRG